MQQSTPAPRTGQVQYTQILLKAMTGLPAMGHILASLMSTLQVKQQLSDRLFL